MRGVFVMRMSLWLFVLVIPLSWLSRSGWADIYAYTAETGAISLSNVPTDERFTVLIKALPEAVERPETPVAALAKPVPTVAGVQPYAPMVDKIARVHGLDSALLHAVIAVESRYNPNAVSRAGASGLMQLMPATARHYGVTDLFDPEQNMHGGARYLSYLLEKFDSDTSLALAAYNAGETAVFKYGNRIPPYRETTDYVQRVLAKYRTYRAEL